MEVLPNLLLSYPIRYVTEFLYAESNVEEKVDTKSEIKFWGYV